MTDSSCTPEVLSAKLDQQPLNTTHGFLRKYAHANAENNFIVHYKERGIA